jgi:2-dehydropantoate 2-reductase
MKSGPRIGIIGSGAVGGFFGLLLARAGFEVHFLLRSEYSALVERGLFLRSQVYGDFHLEKVNGYRDASDMPACDWLLVGTKSTGNAELPLLIARVAAPDAKVLLLQNGLAVEDQLRPFLPTSLHLIGGLCFVDTSLSAQGVIEQQAYGDVNLGYHSGPADGPKVRQAIVEAGTELFKAAQIKATVESDLALARWRKLVFNIPFNGLSVLLNASTPSNIEQSREPQTRSRPHAGSR